MRRMRVTEDEIRQAAQAGGSVDLTQVSAVVLETDGTMSILSEVPPSDPPKIDPR